MQNPDPAPPDVPCRKVAVLAVHGVADQRPNVTARQIANLLVDQDPAAGAFHETRVRVPVREMCVPQLTEEELWSLPSSFTFMYGQITGDTECRSRPRVGYSTAGKPEETYETVCLARAGSDARPALDIYEMYWADLSRLGNTITQILGEFYQLLFHLSSLGRHTVDEARDEVARRHRQEAFAGDPYIRWDRFARAQAFAGAFLTMPIPIMNLFLLCLASLAVPLWVPQWLQEWTVLLGYMAAAAAAVAFVCYAGRRWAWWLFAIAIAGAAWLAAVDGATRAHGTLALLGAFVAALGYGWMPEAHRSWFVLLAAALSFQVYAWLSLPGPALRDPYLLLFAWTIGIGAMCFVILRAYDIRHPGALEWTAILGATTLAATLYFVVEAHPEPVRGILAASETLFVLLTGLWAVLLCLHIWAVAEGAMLKWRGRRAARERPPGKIDLIERVVWTARLALIVPTGLFILMTLALWSGVVGLADQVKPASTEMFPEIAVIAGAPDAPADPAAQPASAEQTTPAGSATPLFPYRPRLGWLFDEDTRLRNFREIGVALISHAASPLAGLTLLLFGISMLLAAWAFLPIVISEIFPPKNGGDARELGEWLDHGFRLLRWSGRVFFVSVIIVFPIGIAMQIARYFDIDVRFPDFGMPTEAIVRWVGAALAGTALAFVTFRRRITDFARGFRPVLDVALDVDNHLRERPLDANPRARIGARYASVLRHICAWRDAHGRPYDALVIVAHSQGTVITADVLRFVQMASAVTGMRGAPAVPADAALTRIDARGANDLPVYLLTVGSPLRQLYGVRFPDLYDWARHTDASEWPSARGPIPGQQAPDPASLNVKQWINAYRSGDYVGRYLWRNDTSPFRWSSEASEDVAATRRELCIGAGAHTHYFDHTAHAVGEEIQRVIEKCQERT